MNDKIVPVKPLNILISCIYLYVCLHSLKVEWIMMRAMSLGLIKGTIDEVESTFSVTWVQPRVLNLDQLGVLQTQIGDWKARYA